MKGKMMEIYDKGRKFEKIFLKIKFLIFKKLFKDSCKKNYFLKSYQPLN
jgi:hypothetical protein